LNLGSRTTYELCADILHQKAFSTQPIRPGSTSSVAQWYTFLSSLQGLSKYIAEACPPSYEKCLSATSSLISADYVDIDYEKDSRSVIFTSFWTSGPQQGAWEEITDYPDHMRVEVGLLHQEAAEDKDEIKLGGWLTVVGYDKNPSVSIHFSHTCQSSGVLTPHPKQNQLSSAFPAATTL